MFIHHLIGFYVGKTPVEPCPTFFNALLQATEPISRDEETECDTYNTMNGCEGSKRFKIQTVEVCPTREQGFSSHPTLLPTNFNVTGKLRIL